VACAEAVVGDEAMPALADEGGLRLESEKLRVHVVVLRQAPPPPPTLQRGGPSHSLFLRRALLQQSGVACLQKRALRFTI
jgi:hypothetical protein